MSRIFDGTDDKLTGAAADVEGPSTALTLAYWVYQQGGTAWGTHIFRDNSYRAQRQSTSDDTIGWSIEGSFGEQGDADVASENITNQFVFVAITWASGEAPRLRVWDADGNSILNEAAPGTSTGTIGGTADDMTLGVNQFGDYLQGRIANLYIHDAKLTDTQLDALRTGTDAANLIEPSVDFWPLNDAGSTETGIVNAFVLNATGTTAQGDRTGVPDISFTVTQVVTAETMVARNGWTDTASSAADAAVIAALTSSALQDAASPWNPVGDGSDTLKVQLATVSSADGLFLRYNYKKDALASGKTVNLTVELRSPDGSVLLDSWAHTNIGTSVVEQEQDISAETISGTHQVWFVPSSS